jgi:hypothetical protein
VSALERLIEAAVDSLARDRAETPQPTVVVGDILVAERVGAWLASPANRLAGIDRADVDALCRQIDVFRRVDRCYRTGWARSGDPESTSPAVRFGLAVVLVGQGSFVADPSEADREGGARLDGFALKCLNSALKLLELDGDYPDPLPVAELRVAALAALDQIGEGGEQS